MAQLIIARVQQLVNGGSEVEIYWMPGHVGVKSNDMADRVVKEAVSRPGIKTCAKRFTWLSHISRTITGRKLKEVKYWFETKHKARTYTQRARYNFTLSTQSPDKAVVYEKTYRAQIYYKLKLGHTITGAFLRRISRSDSDQC